MALFSIPIGKARFKRVAANRAPIRIFASGGPDANFSPRIVFPVAVGLCAALILFFLMRGPRRLIASGLLSADSVEGRRLALIGVFGRDPIR